MANSFVKRASYHVASAEDIMKIPDVKTAVMLLKAWGLQTKGLKTKDQALQRLVDHYTEKVDDEEQQSTDKIERVVNETSERLKVITDKLLEKFESMIAFYNKLPLIHQKSICESYENLESTARTKIQDLKTCESVLAIAGEVGSGQTSMINLLLKSDLLPVCEKGCTKVYCQLKTGETRRATIYSRNSKTKEATIKNLDLRKDTDKDEMRQFIVSGDELNVHERVVIEFPFEFLENGVYLLDIPDSIDVLMPLEQIISELPTNVVFLYVLDVTSANQTKFGQIEEFIQRIKRTAKHSITDNVLIICNKCDLIPGDQLDSVKTLVKKSLMKADCSLSENRIVFISVAEEENLDPSGLHSPYFQDLCKTIDSMFAGNMENILTREYRWLSKVMKRALYTLKVSKLNSSKSLEERRVMMAKLLERIEKFEKDSKLIIERLHGEIDNEIGSLFKKLVEYMNSSDLKASMFCWVEGECPKPQKKWKNIKSSAESSITEKLKGKLNEWENKQQIGTVIKKQIINKFGQEVELMEEQMKKIGAMLVGGDSNAVLKLHRSFRQDSPGYLRRSPPTGDSQESTVKDKYKLSDFVCSIGGYDKAVKKEIKPIFKKYKKDTCTQTMAKATDIYIKCLTNNPHIKEMVARYVKRFSKDINKIAKMIPDLISMDKRLMETLQLEVMETKETIFHIPENLSRCTKLQGEVDLFYVYEMMQLDYQSEDLIWNDRKKLGTGSFADVYPGSLKTREGKKIEVAVKIFRDPLQTNNASEMLLEDETLRELNHKNIIDYYGVTIIKKGRPQRTHWVMLMASCVTNLKDIYLDKTSSIKEDCPGRHPIENIKHMTAKTSLVQYTIQICSGLEYLHSKKLVHRDLKLENILVTKNKEIKLTDVGLTKPEEDISGTYVGSPAYMAPEVHEQRMIYNRKADIYSLAMVLWEIWYGESITDAFDTGRVRGRISIEIRKGARPEFKVDKAHIPPPTNWIQLIEKCWSATPKFRPKARVVKEFFQDQLSFIMKTEVHV